MLLFDFLNLKIPSLNPEECKIHFALNNGFQDPLDVFLQGRFQEWQNEQTQKNFERNYIISLIQMKQSGSLWLFAGLYKSEGAYPQKRRSIFNPNHPDLYVYKTTLVNGVKELIGRLIIDYKKTFRQTYSYAEKYQHELNIAEYTRQPITVPDFLGYNLTSISKLTLDIIVKESIVSYKVALSSVSGIYVITDVATGKLYVGSAYGEDGGIWGRWVEYSKSGHGYNKELKKLLLSNPSYSDNFQFSILEVMDKQASKEAVFKRECYWKLVLSTREHGYNSN